MQMEKNKNKNKKSIWILLAFVFVCFLFVFFSFCICCTFRFDIATSTQRCKDGSIGSKISSMIVRHFVYQPFPTEQNCLRIIVGEERGGYSYQRNCPKLTTRLRFFFVGWDFNKLSTSTTTTTNTTTTWYPIFFSFL